MKKILFLILWTLSFGAAEDYYLDYTQYTSCKYKPSSGEYCDGEESIWKGGQIRINLTDDSLLFVFLGKNTYRIELNRISSDYNSDGEKILILTGRSGSHNYMFVWGQNYFNFLQIHGWGIYFSNKDAPKKSLADSDFGTLHYKVNSMASCFYNPDTEKYDSLCTYYNTKAPVPNFLKTVYRNRRLFMTVDTAFTFEVSDVTSSENSDGEKVLLYYGKDSDAQDITVAIGKDYYNVVIGAKWKLSISEKLLPAELVEESRQKNSEWISGSSVAIAPDILITNAHVIHNMSEMELYLDEKKIQTDGFEIIGEFSEDILDLAIIRVKGVKLNSCPISSRDPRLGEDIRVFGYPQIQYQGSDLKVTKGIVSGKNGFRGDEGTFQIDAAVQPGNSGGPIVADGKIIGLATSILGESQNVNFGVKASKIFHLLQFHGVKPAPTTQDFSLCTYLIVGD